jgi:hypothetical protein
MLQLWVLLFVRISAWPRTSTECWTLSKGGNYCKMMQVVDTNVIKHAISQHKPNHGPTLVKKGINLQRWLRDIRLHEIYHFVHLRAVYEGKNIDEMTTADLFIDKIKNGPQETIRHAISADLGVYIEKTGHHLFPSGGNLVLANEIRRPDLTLCPDLPNEDENPSMPRFLAEVLTHDRSEREADAWCRSYFPSIPQLQTVLLIKVYPRRVSGYFGALAVLYRRERPDSAKVVVEDAVSFGTGNLSARAKRSLKTSSPEILEKLRALPEVPIKPGRSGSNPWDDACRPFILLRREDLFHWKIADNGTRLFIPGCVSKTTKDCKIELWWVLAATNVLSVI